MWDRLQKMITTVMGKGPEQAFNKTKYGNPPEGNTRNQPPPQKTTREKDSKRGMRPQERESMQPSRGGAGGQGGGGGGNDPNDPSDGDDWSEDDSEEDETEDDTETTLEIEAPPGRLPGGPDPKMLKLKLSPRKRQIVGGNAPPGGNGDGGGSPPPTPPPVDPSRRKKRKKKNKTKWVYLVQGLTGPPGQDGKDGHDGAMAHLTAPQYSGNLTQNLDTSGLEDSFRELGKTITGVLNEQRRTNVQMEKQYYLNNNSLKEQADAMRDMAEISAKQTYDHMFAAIPTFDGTDPEKFEDWLESLETLCEESGRNIRTEIIGRSGPMVQRVLKSIPTTERWSVAREELRRCFSELTSKAHAARKLKDLVQGPKENLRGFIHKFSKYHYMTTGRTPEQEGDMTHMVKFLSAIRNVKIARRIAEKRIHDGMTLQDIFTKALDLEAGFQMSESVAERRETEILELSVEDDNPEEISEIAPFKGKNPRSAVCWGCGEHGHYQRGCPYTGNPNVQYPQEEGVVGQMQHTLVTTSDITNKMMGELYKQLAAAEIKGQIYKRGYRRVKTAYQAGTTTNPPTASVVNTAQSVQAPITTVATTLPPALNPVVQLTRVSAESKPPNSYSDSVKVIKIPRGVTNARTYMTSTPTTINTSSSTSAVTTSTAIKIPKYGQKGKDSQISQNTYGPAYYKFKPKRVSDSCQALETIPETEQECEHDDNIDIPVTDLEVNELCEILAEASTDCGDVSENIDAEPEF